MKVALLQANILWENPNANLENYKILLSKLSADVDIILFPETFTTGFSMKTEKLAVTEEDSSILWLRNLAIKRSAAVAASMIFRHEGKILNRLFYFHPDGTNQHYDKRHLFSIGGEGELFQQGKNRLIVKQDSWRICPLICYDLRFPVWSRYKGDYDALIYLANWPAKRASVWRTLLQARAIENQCWVLAVNRSGTDGEGIHYLGDSMIVSPKGEIKSFLGEEEGVLEYEISLEELREFRKKFPVLRDRDEFYLREE